MDKAGDLLKEFDGRGNYSEKADANLFTPRREVAEQAGFSPAQQKTAIRLSNIPQGEFDALVESDNPPTITELEEMGKKSRPLPPRAAQIT